MDGDANVNLLWEGAGICGFGTNQRSLLSFPTAHE
jgi:hypothetical protein